MIVERTIKLKLELSDESKETLRKTMVLSNRIFNEIARYGFDNHTCSKVSVHHATYYGIHKPSPEPVGDKVLGITRGIDFTQKLNNWAFYELEQFIRYKAEAVGKSVVTIDLRYTSQKCSVCGHIYKGNRKGNSFHCVKCGFQIHADLNAARNIAVLGISGNGRLSVTQPYIACDEVENI